MKPQNMWTVKYGERSDRSRAARGARRADVMAQMKAQLRTGSESSLAQVAAMRETHANMDAEDAAWISHLATFDKWCKLNIEVIRTLSVLVPAYEGAYIEDPNTRRRIYLAGDWDHIVRRSVRRAS